MWRPMTLFVAIALPVASCGSRPPANWAAGGAATEVPRAHWERGDNPVDVLADGRVLVDGDVWFRIDRAGRVYDAEGEPLAVLQRDGQLLGSDDTSLGTIGVYNAALPGSKFASVTVAQGGGVVHYDGDGDPHADGGWAGCGAAARTCTLVTHVVYIQEARMRPHFGVGIGVG